MSFDQSTRNRLARFVSDTRRILTDEFTRQCQQEYGIDPSSGVITELGKLVHLNDTQRSTARILRETIEHYIATSPAGGARAAVERLVRAQAFTVLNRLVALRMAEARGIIIESVCNGYQSKGFQLYTRVAGASLGETGSAYACYLFSIFDELSVDLAVLFDRFSPQGCLFPNEAALVRVLEQLNSIDLDMLWVEDETVGWLYQYFNSQEERKKMREESAAPRNSRELAVRNQFFTPRYVVEFLTDNTLGRIWYEMTQADTTLKEQCRYLVRRPAEIFLKAGDTAPEQPKQDNLSQEDLLKQPVHIPHRPLKDPRTILMLDPACGSMHFGLYAFDLFEVIYHEAWALEEKLGADALSRPPGMKSLHDTYAGNDAFMKDVPRLIIEHNLHGIDIDPRCAQIAGLSLWLRAQKAWQRLGLKPAERPAIKRSNIVCAEPMPGEKELLREFVEREFPAAERGVCLRLLEAIFDKMQLAGEAGSLLKIEEEIHSAIEHARRQATTPHLFDADIRSLTSEGFWERIEERIYEALRDYAEQTESGGGFQRRLFAEDAARGFAFIDVCRKRYDVVVMNPPFGTPSLNTTSFMALGYPSCKEDIDAAFIARNRAVLGSDGRLGAIVNRTQLTKTTLEDWRRTNLLGQHFVQECADLGLGVLDAALVETAAYILARRPEEFPSLFFRLGRSADRQRDLLWSVSNHGVESEHQTFVALCSLFKAIPAARVSYWITPTLRRILATFPKLEGNYATARQGTITADNFRFLRLRVEIEADSLAQDLESTFKQKPWIFYAKGGEYSPYFQDLQLVVRWGNDGAEIRNFFDSAGSLLSRPQNLEYNFKRALTYTGRTASNLSVRLCPAGCFYSQKGPVIAVNDSALVNPILGILMSRVIAYFIELSAESIGAVTRGGAARDYTQGIVGNLPLPNDLGRKSKALNALVAQAWSAIAEIEQSNETSIQFVSPFFLGMHQPLRGDIRQLARIRLANEEDRFLRIIGASWSIENEVSELYGLDEAARHEIALEVGLHPGALPDRRDFGPEAAWAVAASADELIDRLVKRDGASRAVTKLCFYANRQLELAAEYLQCSPTSLVSWRRSQSLLPKTLFLSATHDLLSHIVGVAFGRWDIRYATGEQAAPELPDSFAPLPVCSPGQLQNAQGLPARLEDVPAAYPVRIPWDGIVVDDPNHPLDIERRVREVIEIIWSGNDGGPTAEAIEHEACEILGVKSLRDYFRKPAGFFADHLKRYSKSRRQAPIYWPLSTASGSYTLWIYYHRLTDQTLFTVINDFIEPKLKQVSLDSSRLRGKANRSTADDKSLEELIDLEMELKELSDELLRIAGFWKPNLNDGVLITAAPLWRLFKLKPWQKKLKETWEELDAGDYDWAHMALTIAPDRVRLKCKTDKSIAIAHGLEDLYVDLAGAVAKKKPRKIKAAEPMLGDEID